AERGMVAPHDVELDRRLVLEPLLDEERGTVAADRHSPREAERRAVEARLDLDRHLLRGVLDHARLARKERELAVQALRRAEEWVLRPAGRRQYLLPAAVVVVVERPLRLGVRRDERLPQRDRRVPERVEIARLVDELEHVTALVDEHAGAEDVVLE